MLKPLLALFILLSSYAYGRELVIVSDLDDTLRMAAIENKAKAGVKLIGGVKPFRGLQLILSEIQQKNPEAKFYYLSNSFPFLYNGGQWTKKHGFPKGTIMQRSLKDKSDTFKARKLKEIAAKHPSASQWLLFGDNVEKDPMFYTNFLAQTGLPNAQIYIRDTRLIFPVDQRITYFQHEAQILDDLAITPRTSQIVRSLPLSAVVPKYMFTFLKKRLLKACKLDRRQCRQEAKKEVAEVRAQLENLN